MRRRLAAGLGALVLGSFGLPALVSGAGAAFVGTTGTPSNTLAAGSIEGYRPSAVAAAARTAPTTCTVGWTAASGAPSGATYDVSDGAGTVLASGLTGTAASVTAPAATITPAVRLTLGQWHSSWVAASTTCPGWPDAPGDVTAEAGDAAVVVGWTPPAANGSAVTGYTATATPNDGGAATTCMVSSAATGCTFSGLTNGLTYTVAVTASNADGTGPAGTASATPRPALLISSDTVLWLDGADASTLLASSTCTGAAATTSVGCWLDKSAQQDHATQASLTARPGLSTVAGHATPSFDGTTQLLVLDPDALPHGTAASSTFVVGRLTDPSAATSEARSVVAWGSPAAGQSRAYQKQGSSALASVAAWGETPVTPGQWPIDGVGILDDAFSGSSYTAWFQGAAGSTVSGSYSTGTTAAYVGAQADGAQLWLGQVPEVIVIDRAVTDAERRAIQEYLAYKWGVTLTPGSPDSVTAIPSSTTALAVSWTAPWDGGAALSDYTVQYRVAGTSTWSTWAHTASTATSATITGLDTFSAYDVRVAGVNAVGLGTWSETRTSATVWNPTALGSAVAWWVDASDAATLTTSSSVLSAWADKSGHARDASQSTATARPTVVAAAMGGRSAVTFDGTSDFLSFDGSFAAGADYTVAAAVSRRSGKLKDYFLGGTTASNDANLHIGWRDDVTATLSQWSTSAAEDCNATVAAYTSESAAVQVGRHSSVDGNALFQNGVAGCAAAAKTTALSSWTGSAIGRWRTGVSASYFDGRVGEIVMTTTALSTSDRQLLEGYLAWKWGTQASLPVGHPYAAAPPTTTAVAPSTPLNVAVTAGDTSAAVSWRAPAWDGGSTTTGYTVTATPEDSTVAARSCTSATTPCTVTGLTNGVTYAVSVTATNALGTGTPSAAVDVVPYPTTLFASSALKVWLDAQYATSLSAASDCSGSNAGTGTGIGCWRDRSGNGWNAVSGATSAVLTASAINGHPALRFSKSNPDYYDVTATGIGTVGSNDRTLFAVANARSTYGTLSTNNAASVVMWSGWNSGIIAHAYGGTTTVDAMQLDGYTSTYDGLYAGSAATGATVVGGVFSSSGGVLTQTLAVNGVPTATATQSGTWLTTPDDLKLGSQSATASADWAYPLDGDVGEVLVFNRALSASERRTVEDYLARRWGRAITPQAPAGVSAAPGVGEVTVDWTTPAWDGGSSITSTTATATPTAGTGYASLPARTCTTATSTCTVTGLTSGITYAVTVAATNAVGTGPASAGVSATP